MVTERLTGERERPVSFGGQGQAEKADHEGHLIGRPRMLRKVCKPESCLIQPVIHSEDGSRATPGEILTGGDGEAVTEIHGSLIYFRTMKDSMQRVMM